MNEEDRQSFEPMSAFGKPGDRVPEVDPDDVQAVWQINNDLETKSPNQRATGFMVFERACKPGADVNAVWYRAAMVSMLTHGAPEELAPWINAGQPQAVVFRTVASIPMEWMEVGIVRKGPPFDVDEFFRRLRETDARE